MQRSASSHPKPGVSQCRGPGGIAGFFWAAGEFSLEKGGWQRSLEGVWVSSGTECKLRSNVCVCGSLAVKWFVQNTFRFFSKRTACRFKPEISYAFQMTYSSPGLSSPHCYLKEPWVLDSVSSALGEAETLQQKVQLCCTAKVGGWNVTWCLVLGLKFGWRRSLQIQSLIAKPQLMMVQSQTTPPKCSWALRLISQFWTLRQHFWRSQHFKCSAQRWVQSLGNGGPEAFLE